MKLMGQDVVNPGLDPQGIDFLIVYINMCEKKLRLAGVQKPG